MGGFNPADFEQKLSAYETWAHLTNPAFGRAVSQVIMTYYTVPVAKLRYGMGGFRGLGDGATTPSEFIDIQPVDVTPLDITPPAPPDFSTFTPADPSLYDPNTIVVTASPADTSGLPGTNGPVSVNPWFPDLTPAPSVSVTPFDFSQLQSDLSTFVPASASSLSQAAKNVASAIGALAAKAAGALGGGAGAGAQSGAAQLKQAAGQSSTASWLPFVLLAAGALVLLDVLNN